MKALLDTHTFLWWVTDSPQISPKVRDIIQDATNAIFLSAASGWEIAVKVKLDRLRLPDKPDIYLAKQMTMNAIQPLAITMNHSLYSANLPDIHKDPFDRIIIAQAILEDMPLLTRDGNILKYNVKVIW